MAILRKFLPPDLSAYSQEASALLDHGHLPQARSLSSHAGLRAVMIINAAACVL
jgi:hypothetical protein